MSAVWVFFRAELRGRWRSWLVLALLAGLFGGLVTAVAAGARRTDAAYSGLVAWSRSPDDLIAFGPGQGPTFVNVPAATIARLPQVTGAAQLTSFTALDPAVITLMAPANGDIPGSLWRRKLLAGRLPDPGQPQQADISFTVAQSQHVGVGGRLRVVLLGAAGQPVTFWFQVAGIEAAPSEFPPQFGFGIDVVWATPAFSRQYGRELLSQPGIAVQLRRGGADVPVVEQEISRLGGGKGVADFPLDPQAANTADSIRQQGVALWLLAGLLTVVSLLVLGQLLARLTLLESDGYGALRAIGMSRAQLAAAGLIRAAVIGAAGSVLAVLLAVAASPLFPVGLAGIAEPHPGVDADWLALGLGMAGVVLATVGCSAWPAWRAAAAVFRPPSGVPLRGRPATSVVTGAIQPVSAAMGVRLALRNGAGRTALPVMSTIAAAAVGVTALTTALVFSASLGNLLDTPRLYGVTWDAIVSNVQFAGAGPAAQSVAHDPEVSAWSGFYPSIPLEIRGVQVGATAAVQGPGGLRTALPVQGRLPDQAGEIALGQRTLAAIHARIGETVEVSVAGSNQQFPRTITGTAVFPPVADTNELGVGADLTAAGLRDLVPSVQLPAFTAMMIRFQPGISQQAGIDALAARVDRLGPFQVMAPPDPADLVNFGEVQALPLLAGGALGVVALLTMAHLLLTSARRRRRDLAVLRVIGFTRGQVRATVTWQAVVLTGVALVIGIPAGIACGRLAWGVFAGQVGILPVVDIPLPALAVLLAAALALAVAVAAVPGASAVRARPADVLRAE